MQYTPETEHGEQFREALWMSARQSVAEVPNLTPEQLEPAFEHASGVCACIDEGVNGIGDIRLAGSGILHPGGIEAVAHQLQRAGVTEVTSHDHCGAAGVAYRQDHGLPADSTVDQAEIDRYAADWSRRLATTLRVPFRRVGIRDLSRPPEIHTAPAVYVVGVDGFKPVEALPQGFVVTAKNVDRAAVVHDTRLAADIALGDHGFGDRFTPENPFTIYTVGPLVPEVEHELRQLVAKSSGRVTMEQFPVPEQVADESAV